jgi:GR25 family glycosyltransferase involved in LPS biosynthesis
VTSVVLSCYAARVDVRAPSEVMEPLVDAVSRYASPSRSESVDALLRAEPVGRATWAVTAQPWDGGDVVAEGLDYVLNVLVDRLHTLFAENAKDVLFVHAGAVMIGSTLVIVPGRSGSGKSTLVAEALRHGGVYYSDDYAVIDPDGLVHPYARRLGLRRPSGARNHVAAEAIGGFVDVVAPEPAGVDLVVSTRFVNGASWTPRPVSGARAALPIIDNTVRARLAPREVAHMAATVARGATTLIGDRGQASDVVAALALGTYPGPEAAIPWEVRKSSRPEPRVPASPERLVPWRRCVVVSLRHDLDRRDRVGELLADADIPYAFADGIPGNALDRETLVNDGVLHDDMFRSPHAAVWAQMNAVGCSLAHLAVIDEVAGSADADPVLILEDDADVPRDLIDRVSRLLLHTPTDVDMLYLGHLFADASEQPPDEGIEPARVPRGMFAYLLWPSGARVIRDGARPLRDPLDEVVLSLINAGRIRALVANPPAVTHPENAPSSIHRPPEVPR